MEDLTEKEIANPTNEIGSNYMTPQYFFKPFRILIERNNRKTLPYPGNLIYYTDGSKKNKRIGKGMAPRSEIRFSLGNTPKFYQADIYAIDLCILETHEGNI